MLDCTIKPTMEPSKHDLRRHLESKRTKQLCNYCGCRPSRGDITGVFTAISLMSLLVGTICILLFGTKYYMYVRLIPTSCVINELRSEITVCYNNSRYYPRTATAIYCYGAFDLDRNATVTWYHELKIGCGETTADIDAVLKTRPVGSTFSCWYWYYDSADDTTKPYDDWLGPLISGIIGLSVGTIFGIAALAIFISTDYDAVSSIRKCCKRSKCCAKKPKTIIVDEIEAQELLVVDT